jgi:tetratricopeptide (TPR) repeat protein
MGAMVMSRKINLSGRLYFIFMLALSVAAVFVPPRASIAAESGDSLFKKAMAAYEGQKFETAADAFGKAGQAYSREKKDLRAAQCFYNQGLCLSGISGGEAVIGAFETAAGIYKKIKDAPGESQSRLQAAQLHMNAMRWDAAAAHYERALAISGKDAVVKGMASEGMGRVWRERGDLSRAEKFFRDAETLYAKNPGGRLRVRLQMAYVAGLRGREAEALSMYGDVMKEASALLSDEKTRAEGSLMIFAAKSDRGEFLLSTGAFEDAKKSIGEALADAENISDLIPPGSEAILNLRNDYAQCMMYLGDFSGAEKILGEVLAQAAATDNNFLSMKVNAALGTLARMRGGYGTAFTFFENFRRLAESSGHVQSQGQALVQLASLYAQTGVWSQAAAHYQEAFMTALRAQDMDTTLRAMDGIYKCDIRNELGLVGRVDYRSAQGMPWRAALTARPLSKKPKPEHQDRGLIAAWRTVDSSRGEIPSPSLEGFRAIRERALRAAPEVRDYYTEVKVSWAIGDAALRLAESGLRSARSAEGALVGLSSGRDDAFDKQYVQLAFETSSKLLRSLAGEGLFIGSDGEFFVQIGGISLEGPPLPGEADGASAGVAADIKLLSQMVALISPNAKETEELQKAIISGAPMPESMKSRLRRAAFARASKPPKEDGELLGILYRVLESTHPSLKKEAGRLAEKGGKLYEYGLRNLRAQEAALMDEAKKLLPGVAPYMLMSIDAGDEMARYLAAWRRTRGRALVFGELGLSPKADKDWAKFLSGLGEASKKAGDAFGELFAMSPGDAEGTAETAARLRSLAEKIVRADIMDEGRNIGSILASEGNISHDDRIAMRELQARVRYTLSSLEGAEESALSVLSMLGAASGDTVAEANPDMQWRAYGILARVEEGRGNHSRASEFYAAALSRLDAINPLGGTTSQGASDKTALYGGAIRAAYELWKLSPSQEASEKLWLALERMKSRQWREMLATTGGEFLNALPPDDRERVREMEILMVALDGAYRRAAFAGRRDEMERINEEMRALREQRAALTKNRTVDVDGVPGPGDTGTAMPGDWALANYYISPSLSFALVLKNSGDITVVPLDVDYDSLFGYSFWMRFVGDGNSEYDENKFPVSGGRPRVTSCGLSPEDVAAMIFNPVAEACGGIRKLVIIPHDILYVLPMEALQKTLPDGRASFLINDWTFAELPSAFLLTRESGRGTPENSLMVVANPAYASMLGERTWRNVTGSLMMAASADEEFGGMIDKYTDGSGISGAEADERAAAISGAFKKAWGDILDETSRASPLARAVKGDFAPKMSPLDGSHSEALGLMELWGKSGGSDPEMLLVSHASEGEFWDSDPGKYRYVHIACHGYDRGSIPDLQPGLALSPLRDPENDSFLQMGELSTVRWNAELITLSACETGLGDLYVGDGMFGLSTVLLAGGAKGAVLTRWRAVDSSASSFMRDFYARVFSGAPPAEALRAAQLGLLSGGDDSAPRHWAVFKYVGIPW